MISKEESLKRKNNSLEQLKNSLPFQGNFGNSQISSIDTTSKMLRNRLITTNRSVLSYLYLENGIVQAGINMPVQDAFKGGVSLQTDELNEDEQKELKDYLQLNDVIEQVKQTIIWSRVFGGAGLIIEDGNKSDSSFSIESIKEDTPLKFYSADLWELSYSKQAVNSFDEVAYRDDKEKVPFLYYGTVLDRSRVETITNRRSPSLTRPQLRGWGVSEIEHILPALNVYQKLMEFIFEATDEAKIDVFKITGYNASLLSSGQAGADAIAKHLQVINSQKNYHNGVAIDADDDFIQKQLNLGGFEGLFKQATKSIANSWNIPENFLFGQGSTGLSGSNEEELEKYNNMITAQIRDKYQSLVLSSLKICCKKLFGFIPEKCSVKWEPLKTLTTEQEEVKKDKILQRYLTLFDRQIITSDTLINHINKANVFDESIESNEFVNIFAKTTKETTTDEGNNV